MPTALSKTKLTIFRKFLQKKTREEQDRFFVEGWHLLDEAMKADCRLHALVFDPSARRETGEETILDEALGRAGEAYEGTASQLGQLSDTKASQGVMALVDRVGCDLEKLMETLPEVGPVRLVLLDELGDPGNCGAIVRSCDWFGMHGVIFGKGCAELENGKTARSTMGGLFHLPVAVGVDLVDAVSRLREAGIHVFTTELDESAVSLSDFAFPERCAIVLGNEARGVSDEVSAAATGRIFAPRFGKGDSLNAAAAASVFLAKWRV
ncbi:RNA methyltransferase [Pelagicoccus sp. SDUM812002]|uniref:TrmH family RNA methyltransferase n=1 Tax=Pelagicoccus sp. SDUM812002 TaxID=3041266 RepID=UPI0028102E90|nr:RNA methyltransferase [Pelagicoccus sp. SDUM812002]MDQ8187633.1 RNA methyltransferase [Pelagicoccus sp. SDUM812002]